MKREPESELKVYSWGALFEYVRQCHDEIDFLTRVRHGQSAMIDKEQDRWQAERDRANVLDRERDRLARLLGIQTAVAAELRERLNRGAS